MYLAETPDITVSEDARLVAIRTSDGSLSINRSGGSRFILDNWLQGYGAERMVKPAPASPSINEQFDCLGGVCTALEQGGLIVAYTENPARAGEACESGDIVVLAFAGPLARCHNEDSLVITKQDLARRGALEISLANEGVSHNVAKGAESENTTSRDEIIARHNRQQRLHLAKLNYAVGPPARPWNAYRIYSRAARGLPQSGQEKKGEHIHSGSAPPAVQ